MIKEEEEPSEPRPPQHMRCARGALKIEWFEIRQNYLSNIVFVGTGQGFKFLGQKGVTGEAKVSRGVHAGSMDTFKKG